MPFFCISEPPTPGSALRLNADVLLVSDSMDPPTALSWILLEPLDTSLGTETRVRTLHCVGGGGFVCVGAGDSPKSQGHFLPLRLVLRLPVLSRLHLVLLNLVTDLVLLL